MNDVEAHNLELYGRVLAALETPDEALAFMRELCTHRELRDTAQRLEIAELLIQEIPKQMITRIMCDGDGARRPSTATINRVNEVVKNGDGHLCKMIARAKGVEGS